MKWLWACGFVLILSTHSHWWIDSASLVPLPSRCVLWPDDAWQVPAALIGPAVEMGQWWFLLFSAVAAGVIAFVCRGHNRAESDVAPQTLLALAGMSLLVKPSELLCASIILGIAVLASTRRFADRPLLGGFLILGCGFVGTLCLLEFGLVLAVCVCVLGTRVVESRQPGHRQLNLISLATAIGMIVAAAYLLPGFLQAILRPVSWLWIQASPELLASLSAPIANRDHWLPLGLLVAWMCVCWKDILEQDRAVSTQILAVAPMFALSLIGLGCSRYLFLATFTMAAFAPATQPFVFRGWEKVVLAVGLILSAGYFIHQTDTDALLTGNVLPEQVDPAKWETHGDVLLLNLDHASDWETPSSANRFPLIVNDRWDVFGEFYPTYSGVCRDLKEVRVNSYLRTDGRWGGYRRWVNEWSPTLLVVDSGELSAIRGLTLSPGWRLMGIDGKRTIFGNQDAPQNARQMRAALRCILNLEWPVDLSDDELARTIVTTTPADRRKVAAVLNAMRLPYAALRFLRNDDGPTSEELRVWCYLELAHRVHQHSGRASLLDQFRAVAQVRDGRTDFVGRPSERIRVGRSLTELGLHSLAQKLGFAENVDTPAVEDVVELEPDTLEFSLNEQALRGALLEGDAQAATQLLAEIEDSRRDYYATLVSSAHSQAGEFATRLERVIVAKDFPQELLGEAYFYLGCAALEAGDTGRAVSALIQSQEIAPAFALKAIRQVYLVRLTRQ